MIRKELLMFPQHLLQKFSSAFSIPLQAYKKDKLLFSCGEQFFSPNPALYFMQPYLAQDYAVCFVVSPDYLMSGCIHDKISGEFLIIGPACPYELSTAQARTLLKEMQLSSTRLEEMLRWFHTLPRMDIPSFRSMLDFLNAMLYPGNEEVPLHVTYKRSPIRLEGTQDTPTNLSLTMTSEQKILLLIEHGRPDELKEYLDSHLSQAPLHMGTLGPNAIRSAKNIFISSVSISSRAALKGGVNYDTLISLTDYYIMKVESLTLFSDIMSLMTTTMLDFARRVELCQCIHTDSPIVTKICRCVERNLHVKTSTKDIAKQLSFEPTYLCHLFKKETGRTLTDYIQERKIREACYLLDSTSLPLAAISERLGYSSQQQFQAIFKKRTGMTPGFYRNQQLASPPDARTAAPFCCNNETMRL